MNQKIILTVVVIALIGAGLVFYNNQQQSQQLSFAPPENLQPLRQEVRQEAAEVAKTIEKEQQQVAAEVDKAEQQAQAKANTLQSKIKELLAKAKAYIDNGDYEQALKAAQQVLTQFDPGSSEAKSLVQQAKDGLQKLVQQKIAEDPAKAAQGALGGMLGQ